MKKRIVLKALLFAARNGDIKAVRRIFESFDDDYFFLTAKIPNNLPEHDNVINVASIYGRLDIVKYLVEVRKAGVNMAGSTGRTPLMRACEDGGNLELVKYFVEKCNADLELTDDIGMKAVHIAAALGSAEIVEYLLKLQPELLEQPSQFCGQTPLLSASFGGNVEVVKYLIESHHANVSARDHLGASTALHLAASFGNLRVVQYFVQKKLINIDVACQMGRTPLLEAVVAGHVDIAEYLVDNGADFDWEDIEGCNALHLAAQAPDNQLMMDFVLYMRPEWLEVRCTFDGRTPLLKAAALGLTENIKYLAWNRSANVHETDSNDLTCLKLSHLYGHKECTQVLERITGDCAVSLNKPGCDEASEPPSDKGLSVNNNQDKVNDNNEQFYFCNFLQYAGRRSLSNMFETLTREGQK